ncbi:MAG TPA: lipoyl(octanoyl) transferase LipB [Phycisphaerales bacterium]|nr:lipoyl(octanoyl) transferase LipB [Phycisphaerales bacterium]
MDIELVYTVEPAPWQRIELKAPQSGHIEVFDLGRAAYRPAYERQLAEVERVLASRDSGGVLTGSLLLVEHDPVITVSNRPTAAANLTATPAMLARAGVSVEPTDRGGDITYHGPGQLVAYPILDLNRLRGGLRLHDYMRLLEQSVIDTLASFGIQGEREPGATGVWVGGAPSSKIAAMGVRVKRWVSMHGLALNVDPHLGHFDLIVPCGLAGRSVTSMARVLGQAPSMSAVKACLVQSLAAQLSVSR